IAQRPRQPIECCAQNSAKERSREVLRSAKSGEDAAVGEERVVVRQLESANGGSRPMRWRVAGQAFAHDRLDRHGRDVRTVVSLCEKMPAHLDRLAVTRASRANEHSPAVLSEPHQVEYSIEQR